MIIFWFLSFFYVCLCKYLPKRINHFTWFPLSYLFHPLMAYSHCTGSGLGPYRKRNWDHTGNKWSWYLFLSRTSVNISTWYYSFQLVTVAVLVPYLPSRAMLIYHYPPLLGKKQFVKIWKKKIFDFSISLLNVLLLCN